MATGNAVNYNLGGMTNTGLVKYNGTTLVSSSTALLDSSNRLTNSSQPCFEAIVSSSISNVTGDGTTYGPIIFNSVQFDQNSNYNNATGIFTCPIAGRCFFAINIVLTGLLAAHTSLICQIVAGPGSQEIIRMNPFAASVAGALTFSGSAILTAVASRNFSVSITVSGGTKAVSIGGTAPNSSFSGVLLC